MSAAEILAAAGAPPVTYASAEEVEAWLAGDGALLSIVWRDPQGRQVARPLAVYCDLARGRHTAPRRIRVRAADVLYVLSGVQ